MRKKLPQELKTAFRKFVALLGEVIRENEGDDFYQEIESIRQSVKLFRDSSPQKAFNELHSMHSHFVEKDDNYLAKVAHSFAVLLELANACENAYRIYRLGGHPLPSFDKLPERIVYVLTAHPTESRSAEFVTLFYQIQHLIIEYYRGKYHEEDLKHFLKIALKMNLARTIKPTIYDEAEYVYSILLREEIIGKMLRRSFKYPLYFRSWVGGDKDGHPDVNDLVFLESLSVSRKKILSLLNARILDIQNNLDLLSASNSNTKDCCLHIDRIRTDLASLEVLALGDAERVLSFKEKINQLRKAYAGLTQGDSPRFRELDQLMELFPGLVVPLEFREDASVLATESEERSKIKKMLEALNNISRGGSTSWYVRGLVISMTEKVEDLLNALELICSTLKCDSLPVVPLFETSKALTEGAEIVKTFFSHENVMETIRTNWGNKFEVMLGYSDSAKESGALHSRILIRKAMFEIEKVIAEKGITPIFFHGSGGSVARGGGSLDEQTAWWPKSTLNFVKMTIQGEMVARNLSGFQILIRQLGKISSRFGKRAHRPGYAEVLAKFSKAAFIEYSKAISNPKFLEIVERTTTYRYLSLLKIGSRPSKRGTDLSIKNMRAIPWVLCWTQNRVLFPAWWGLGTSFKGLTPKQKTELRSVYRNDAFFRSIVKLVAFSLAKVELPVFRLYLNQFLGKEDAAKTYQQFAKEFEWTKKFVFSVTGKSDLLFFRPWLAESIRLRSAIINILNVIQVISIDRKNEHLLRETVTGIACGMLTTG